MNEGLIAIFFIIVFILVVVVLLNSGSRNTKSQLRLSSSRALTPQMNASHIPKSEGSLDSLLGLIGIGLVGYAAYKFIQSGGLKKLMEEIGRLTINVNGEYKTIHSAIREESFVENLLREAIQKKLRDVSAENQGLESLSENTPKAAADVANMLRDALEARMRRERI
jgi:preprotein translocase subunit SecG